MDLKEKRLLGKDIDRHWYYRSKAKAMLLLIHFMQPCKVMDIGAGSGFFSREILKCTTAKQSICVDPNYDFEFDAVESGKNLFFRLSVNHTDADLLLLMDVLEHVDNDIEFLSDYASQVPSGTHFLISVPAFQFLWSGHDVFLGHRRRYTLRQLEKTAISAGLEVCHGCYFFGMVFPLAAIIRLATRSECKSEKRYQSQLKKHSALVNGLLERVCRFELPIMKYNRFAGLTAFCVACKK